MTGVHAAQEGSAKTDCAIMDTATNKHTVATFTYTVSRVFRERVLGKPVSQEGWGEHGDGLER